MEKLLAEAIQKLEINVPVMRYEIKGSTVTLWLYGKAEPVTYRARAQRSRSKTSKATS